MVIWLLGISGSGKTTLGNKLKQHFDDNSVQSFIIDGDLVRDFYDNDLGYSKEDRITNIKRIILAAYCLEQNGIVPIICNISPYQDLRDFARKKLDKYIEVYLKRDLNQITNKNHIYINNKNVVGIDLEFDLPTKADITIDTSKTNIDNSIIQILKTIK